MVSTKKINETKTLTDYQPHMSMAVAAIIYMNNFISGFFYLDTGMAVWFVFRMKCKIRRVTIKLKSRVSITSTLGKALDIMGIASLMVILMPTLEIDLGGVSVN